MDIQIIEHIKETLSVVIQCNKIDDEVMRLKSHIESFANSHFPRPAGPHFPARQGHIKRPVLESGTGVQGREGLHPASL